MSSSKANRMIKMVATISKTGTAQTTKMNPMSGSLPSLYPKNVIQKLMV